MDNQQATDFDIGWLAGIVDGEGWLGMTIAQDRRGTRGADTRRTTVKAELKITNCDEAIIERAASIIARLGVNPYRRAHKQHGINRIIHECSFKHMVGMEKVLPILLPHLTGIKHQRAGLILRFVSLRRANVGSARPGYDPKAGSRGPRTIRPYTAAEMALVDTCRALQSLGASEATRENRERALKALHGEHAQAV